MVLSCFKKSIPKIIFLRATAEKERGCADDGMILNAKQMLGRGKLSVIVETFSRFFAHADSKRMRFLGAEKRVFHVFKAPNLVSALSRIDEQGVSLFCDIPNIIHNGA